MKKLFAMFPMFVLVVACSSAPEEKPVGTPATAPTSAPTVTPPVAVPLAPDAAPDTAPSPVAAAICTKDVDCAGDMLCVSGACVVPSDKADAAPGVTNDGSPNGMLGTTEDSAAPSAPDSGSSTPDAAPAPAPFRCKSAADCATGQYCLDGMCLPSPTSPDAGTDSGSDAAPANTGTDSGTTYGVLNIVVVNVDQTTKLHMQLFGDEVPLRNDGLHWGNTGINADNASSMSVGILVTPGAQLVFNGQSGSSWWCTDALQRNVIIKAMWNGQLAAPPVPKANGTGGCNFVVTAQALVPNPADKDGDGHGADDCDDNDPMRFPGQLETHGDQVDYDCNGFIDPPSWNYTVSTQIGFSPMVVDVNSWSEPIQDFTVTYPMTWNGSAYVASIPSWIAPHDFFTRWWQNGWMAGNYLLNGVCIAPNPTVVTESFYNTDVLDGTQWNTMDAVEKCHYKMP